MRSERKVSDHLLVAVDREEESQLESRNDSFRKILREFVTFDALQNVRKLSQCRRCSMNTCMGTYLDSSVEDENVSVVGRLENENVLVQRLLHVENLLDPEGHGLTCS